MGEEGCENFNKELKNRKKNETELKNTDTKIKNILKEIKSRLDNTGEWISDLEDSSENQTR